MLARPGLLLAYHSSRLRWPPHSRRGHDYRRSNDCIHSCVPHMHSHSFTSMDRASKIRLATVIELPFLRFCPLVCGNIDVLPWFGCQDISPHRRSTHPHIPRTPAHFKPFEKPALSLHWVILTVPCQHKSAPKDLGN
jgi:hypothetical protein